jgi:osmoprotectant transport system permease protein
MISDVFTWLNDPAHWRGSTGIAERLGDHVGFCVVAQLIALALALPAGLYIGHTGKATWVVSATNTLRSLPTIGLLFLLTVLIAPHFHGRTDAGFLIPTEIVLILLAVPPILANTVAGVQNIDSSVRDAAAGMGMTGIQVLGRVELPCSLPLVFSGLRSAALQVIATATVASSVTLGGLGRFIYDGLAQQDYPQTIGGAVLVALLAVSTDFLLALGARYTVSPGITGRSTLKNRTTMQAQLTPIGEL